MPTLQDLPDVEGDRQHNIQTFATQLGVRNISLAVSSCMRKLGFEVALTGCELQAIGMLLASYATAIALALRLPGTFNAPIMVAGHAVLAVALLLKVRVFWRVCSTCSADLALRRRWSWNGQSILPTPFKRFTVSSGRCSTASMRSCRSCECRRECYAVEL